MKVAILIPARYKSSRFEGKPLAKIASKPMIERVYNGVVNSKHASFSAILTDDERIFEQAKLFGANVFMVKGNFESGTDRIAYFAKDKEFDYIVNMQGDEPLIDSKTIDKLIQCAIETNEEMATLIAHCEENLVDSPNTVKVAVDKNGYALYFSRSKIPYNRNEFTHYLKHIGIYIYSKDALMKLYNLPKGSLEQAESLEQLRALENSIKIKTCITNKKLIGVDTKEDLKKVEEYLLNSGEK
jgi:3-deoxy-manno-octulosonate cytidylyltransferase (CMP-KDO synthetase)